MDLCCVIVVPVQHFSPGLNERRGHNFMAGIYSPIDMVRMENNLIEKGKAHVLTEIIGYCSHSISIRSILKKPTGSINAVSFDTGEVLAEKIFPFDTFVEIIDGKAEIIIDGVSHLLDTGQSIIIPAHASKTLKANERFKMISTIIKSGYE